MAAVAEPQHAEQEEPYILALAKSILSNTQLISAYLSSQNLPQPSFDVDGPGASPVPLTYATPTSGPDGSGGDRNGRKDEVETAMRRAEEARQAVMEAAWELRILMMGPVEYCYGYRQLDNIGMQTVSRFRIPQSFPPGETRTMSEIAATTMPGIPVSTTKRLLRHAISRKIFCEPTEGIVAHNAVSKAMADDPRLVDFMAFTTGDIWPAAGRVVDAVVEFPESQELNQSGFSKANNTELAFFETLSKDPTRMQRFGNGMSFMGQNPAARLEFMVNGWPWQDLNDGLVVDVGGSQGKLCQALATTYPRLRFVSQDLPHVIKSAPPLPEDIGGRVEMMEHNFFDEQPVHGADVYFFRWILHNWTDKYAIQMLRNLVPAFKQGSKVLVADEVAPLPGSVTPAMERRLRDQDMTMLALFNARVRELEEWKDLFATADSRFQFRSANRPAGSSLTILDFEWTG